MLFAKVRPLWPSQIALTVRDRVIWSLWDHYQAVEAASGKDEWLQLSAWCFHTAISNRAERSLRNGSSSISPRAIEIGEFERHLVRHLNIPEWKSHKARFRQTR
jgi:hypothetical protein